VPPTDPTRSRSPDTPGRFIAGLLATFDTEVTDVEPTELRHAGHTLVERFTTT
jgi:hypothetical protein